MTTHPPPDYRVIFESMAGSVLVLAPDAPTYTIVAATDMHVDAAHVPRAGIVGRGAFDVAPNDPRLTRAALDAVVRTSESIATQTNVRGRWWRTVDAPVLESDGSLRYIIHRVEDVTHAEQRSAAVVAAAPFAVALTRVSDGAVVSANPAFFRLFELTPDDVIGKTGVELGIATAEVERELETYGVVRNFEYTHEKKSGATCALLLSLDGVIVDGDKHVLTTIQDITDVKAADERLRDLDALERLQRVSGMFLDERRPESILGELLDTAMAISGASFGNVQIVDPASRELEIVVHRNLPAWWLEFWERVTKQEGACGTALHRAERVIVEDIRNSPLFTADALQMQLLAGIRAVQSTPLVARSGLVVGMMSTHFRAPHRPPERVLRMLDLVARQAADILEHARAEEALRRSEATARGILLTAGDAIISIDEQRRIVMWNDMAEKMFGYTRDEALALTLDRLVPERFRATHVEHVAAFAAGHDFNRKMDHSRTFGLRKDGEEFAISAMISKLAIDDERIMTVSVRDVTEDRRRESEQRLLADVGAALASLDHDAGLASLAHAIVEGFAADFGGVYVMGEAGEPIRSATATKESATARVVDVLKKLPAQLPHAHPARRAAETRKPVVIDLEDATFPEIAQSPEHLRTLREIHPRFALAVPLLVGDDCVGALGVASTSVRFDERATKLAEEVARRSALFVENARMHASERRAIRARDDVLGIVAHDLRNPLMTIMLQAQVLGRRKTEPEVQRPGGVIERAAKRMNRIIQDLLDVSRLEAGTLELTRSRVPVAAVLAAVLEAEKSLVTSPKVVLKIDAPANLPDVLADHDRVLQVFENLVGNAVKFTVEGSITVGARAGDGEIVFSVADTGCGIAAEHLPHVFDRFWRADTTKREGAGLGLAIVKGIVEAYGGRVWVESSVGVGTAFHFTLPVAS